jgi:hypothetical protein
VPIFKFLHIAALVSGVAFSVGGAWLLERIASTHDVRAIRGAFGVARPLAILINAGFGLGFLFGMLAAYFGQINLLAPWLIAAYVLFVITSFLGGSVSGKWMQSVGMNATKNQGDTPSPELEKILDDPRPRQVFWFNVAAIIVFLFLMVFRPGGM